MTKPARSILRRLLLAAALSFSALAPAALHLPAADAQFVPSRPIPAAAAPVTLDIGIEPGGTEALLIVRGSEHFTLRHSVRRVTEGGDTPVPPAGVPDLVTPLGGAVLAPVGPPPAPVYDKEHRIRLANLESNTTYEVAVNGTAVDGRHGTASARFTTLRERLRITLESIDIEDDGDGIFTGNGDPLWKVDLTYLNSNFGTTCFPLTCEYGNWGEGRIVPRTADGTPLYWLLAEEVSALPDELTLTVRAYEDDLMLLGASVGFCDETQPAETTYRRPQNVESHTAHVQVRGDDGEGFKSVLTFRFETYHDAFDMSQF